MVTSGIKAITGWPLASLAYYYTYHNNYYLLSDAPVSRGTEQGSLNTNPIIREYHRPRENIVSQLYEVNKSIEKESKDLNTFFFLEMSPYYRENIRN